jgi:hypothetical protein
MRWRKPARVYEKTLVAVPLLTAIALLARALVELARTLIGS